MQLLVDTHLLLWAAGEPDKLTPAAREYLENPDHALVFSTASLWEIVIKRRLDRPDFQVDPALLRRGLLENGWEELPIQGRHALAVGELEPLHRDPFDHLLIAQAKVEGMLLLTADTKIAAYEGPIARV